MRRRIVSIWLPRLATDLLIRKRRHWRDNPLALYVETGPRLIIMAVNEAAEDQGVTPGLSLADARALVADLTARPLQPERQAKSLRALLRWLDRFSPLAAIDGVDGVFLDATGVTHLFGGERAFLQKLEHDIAALELDVRLGLASTPGAAWALARYGQARQIAGPGETREALAHLPVASLRLEQKVTTKLMRLGITHVENLYALPRKSLVRRFGVKTAARLDQALGSAPEPISPARAPAPYIARLAFDDPIGERASVEDALKRLIARLADQLKRHGKGATRLTFTIGRVDGAEQSLSIGIAEPTRQAQRITRLFAEKLDTIDPGFGIAGASLSADLTETLENRQIDALGASAPSDALTKLIDTLGNRLGFEAVSQYAPVDRWQPEHSFRRAPASARPAIETWPQPPGPRPMQLLRRPEPIEVSADPGDALSPPQALRRHGIWRKLNHAQGPERITPEWRNRDPDWLDQRDYWRAQDETGARLWLYRAGEKWFLHGFFA